jgi:hypothetical protein
VVEIDGISHEDKMGYDIERQQYLEAQGLKVFRITDSEVKKMILDVMEKLEAFIVCEYRTIPTPPMEGN